MAPDPQWLTIALAIASAAASSFSAYQTLRVKLMLSEALRDTDRKMHEMRQELEQRFVSREVFEVLFRCQRGSSHANHATD